MRRDRDRSARAEAKMGWHPIPNAPRHYRRALTRASRALAAYALDGDGTARRRFAAALDDVVGDARFGQSPLTFRTAVLNRTGLAHNWCGIAEPGTDDLDLACGYLTAGLRIAAPASVERARLEYNLGNTLLNLYQRQGDPGRLSEALRHTRASIEHVGTDEALTALCRCGLAAILRTSFRVTGDPEHLAEAVDQAEAALSAATTAALRSRTRYVLSDVLSVRYDVHGRLDDLNRAIALIHEIPGLSDPTLSGSLGGTLGTLLRRRYLRTRDRGDLDEAIGVMEADLEDEVSTNPARLTNLGNALLTRYSDFGDEGDLSRAVGLQMRAVEATGPGDWQLASRHNNAGNALSSAWEATGDPRLADAAVDQYRAALALTAERAPERASREYNLARVLQARSQDPDSVADGVAAYRDAVRHGLDTSLEWALSAARAWGRWAAARGSWPEACEAYGNALEAAHQLFRIQLLREEKEAWLAESQGLPAEAAHALLRTGRPEEAVLALEAGRSLLLSEVLERDRAGLDRLAGTPHADLARQYRATTSALDRAMHAGAETSVLRGLREAVETVVAGIRRVDGYQRFLMRPGLADIRRAVPEDAVLVHLAAAEAAGLAVTIGHDGTVHGVELPALTAASVRRRVESLLHARRGRPPVSGRWEGTLDAVTAWAWSAFVAPVLPMAGADEDLVLVPSGMLAMLPLHAAWRPTRQAGVRHYLLDERTVSYAPNARALEVTARTARRARADSVLVVADPRPTSWEPIGYARAETAWARHWFATVHELSAAAADPVQVQAEMARAPVHHFICHGVARPDDPLRSALILAHDTELTLRDVLALPLVRPGPRSATRLVVLSACDTDRPGTHLPDEVISLPTGLIQAGVAGVVATQWAVRSEAVSLLMARFYQLWRGDGRAPAAALRAAQRWLRDTTNGEKIRDLAPAARSNAGDQDLMGLVRALRLRDPEGRPYTHPTDWAALSYHGS
ncbi:CHAT domain-containing protein [Streptomyces anandii]|uniref:CHAT domain-containing protein n=1 Tax=Streptomyces anandii TaxID=285454 RepID=UPI0037029DA1